MKGEDERDREFWIQVRRFLITQSRANGNMIRAIEERWDMQPIVREENRASS